MPGQRENGAYRCVAALYGGVKVIEKVRPRRSRQNRRLRPSLRANGSAPTGRANARSMTGSAPLDDRLREAILNPKAAGWIASSFRFSQ